MTHLLRVVGCRFVGAVGALLLQLLLAPEDGRDSCRHVVGLAVIAALQDRVQRVCTRLVTRGVSEDVASAHTCGGSPALVGVGGGSRGERGVRTGVDRLLPVRGR